MDHSDPFHHHKTKLAARQVTQKQLSTRDRYLSYTRLLLITLIFAVGWGALARGSWSGWWLLIPCVGFAAVIRTHNSVIRAHESASRSVAWYQRGLARLEDRWPGSGEAGSQFIDTSHAYADDLDLFGDGSMFQLLCTAQTTTGTETLSRWLLQPAEPEVVRHRQVAATDLATRPQLLEDLYALGVEAKDTIDSISLVEWATAPRQLNLRWLPTVLQVLTVGLMLALTAWSIGLLPGSVPVAVLLINVTLGLRLHHSVSPVLHRSDHPAQELAIMAAIIGRLRTENYNAHRLGQLQNDLLVAQAEPVDAVRRLRWFIEMHDWQHNLFFTPIAAVLLWGPHCAIGVEKWRQRYGHAIEQWLTTVGEFETLAAFGIYRFEHPDYSFPVFLENQGHNQPPIFEARELAHPLLPRDHAVPNDVTLGATPQLLIISGSNMSGKTTLMRAVGTNAVLALAGAPVRAQSLRLSFLTIGGTIRVQDSLLEGKSRFYAEILRIKTLLDIAHGKRPLLFLVDELFHGTNSNDRFAGAKGVLNSLITLNAIGMVTTHDLALTDIGKHLDTKAANMYFTDTITSADVSFDYRLRKGIATQGNGLALMQAVGLDVDTPSR